MNQGTEAKMVARRLRRLNKAQKDGLSCTPSAVWRFNVIFDGYCEVRTSNLVTAASAFSCSPRADSQFGLSTMKNRPRVTRMAGNSAVANIQRQALRSGTRTR